LTLTDALEREARSQLLLHLVFLALAIASLIAILATTPFVAALFPNDQDPWIGFAWLALGAPRWGNPSARPNRSTGVPVRPGEISFGLTKKAGWNAP
jgi:hypothetical protein